MGVQACTEASYHNFRKERLSAAEAGAATSLAEEPKGPCLVPATVQTEPAAPPASQPAEHPASVPQHEPHWVKVHPSVGIHHIRLAWAWLLLGLAVAWLPAALSHPCLLNSWG